MTPPPTASPRRSKPTSMIDLAARFSRGRDRRVEQLVARRGTASRGRSTSPPRATIALWRPGANRPPMPRSEQGERRRAGGDRESELLEGDAAAGRLHHEGDQADRRVIHGEEAQQAVAAPEGGDRLHLEDVIHERRANRAEQHERGEVPEVRRFAKHAKSRPCRRRFEVERADGQGVVRLAVPRARRRICHAHTRFIAASTGSMAARRRRAPTRSANEPAEQAAERAGAGNLPEALFRGARVEPLGGDQPEARPEQRTDAGDLQVDDDGADARSGVRQAPSHEEQHGAARRRRAARMSRATPPRAVSTRSPPSAIERRPWRRSSSAAR